MESERAADVAVPDDVNGSDGRATEYPWTARVDDLCIGATEPKKVIHHEGCRHARRQYGWAKSMPDVATFAYELVHSGAWRWHRFCQACCGDVDEAVKQTIRAAEEAIGGGL